MCGKLWIQMNLPGKKDVSLQEACGPEKAKATALGWMGFYRVEAGGLTQQRAEPLGGLPWTRLRGWGPAASPAIFLEDDWGFPAPKGASPCQQGGPDCENGAWGLPGIREPQWSEFGGP